MQAINEGYDEITHINWIIMQAMPDDVIKSSNGIMRFEGPGRYAKDIDLDGLAINTIVNTMARKHIYNDPTMVAFEGIYVRENGDMAPAYAPFAGTMPPATERSFRIAGLTPAEALAAATIVPARLVGQEAKTGSIKIGKIADLALVEGDPSTHIADLRQTRLVMLDGKLLDADALRSAAGFSGRPRSTVQR
jgi:hypothetical protein